MYNDVIIEGIVKGKPERIDNDLVNIKLKNKNIFVLVNCYYEWGEYCNYFIKPEKKIRVFGELDNYNNFLTVRAKHIEMNTKLNL